MKILISACLMGHEVRYDGQHNKIESQQFDSILNNHDIYILCPEIEGGLTTPRPPAEIVEEKVMTCDNEDVTRAFTSGALKALELCLDEDITVAILKANSPSCGNIQIYDGTFNGKLVQGSGKTAQMLQEHGITVFNETQLKEVEKFLQSSLIL